MALEEVDPARKLYLAVPDETYSSFFQRRFIRSVIERTQIRLLTYDQSEEVIRRWL
ncbi:element excision factor XisH family protein [Leptolyngbya sp. BC1307]|uniref:element excision factor XisH family protein n=1 Tax=Leptolyngbya sp. BC1307 TaxID=2029589 RepID=UPI003204865D